MKGDSLLSPSRLAPAPRCPGPSFMGAGGKADRLGAAQLKRRCSVLKQGAGLLEWWVVPCIYRRVRLARRWRWMLHRRGAGLMPSGRCG